MRDDAATSSAFAVIFHRRLYFLPLLCYYRHAAIIYADIIYLMQKMRRIDILRALVLSSLRFRYASARDFKYLPLHAHAFISILTNGFRFSLSDIERIIRHLNAGFRII